MAVVVTGAAGFIGRAVTDLLLRRGERVVAVDRRPVPARPGLVPLTADLLDGDDMVTAALVDADAVVHLAGCPGVRDARPDVAAHRHRDNVVATSHVLAAVPARTPVVAVSSSSVYGGATAGRRSAESDPLRPRGGYAESKAAMEAVCARRVAAGAQVVVARPFTVAGEGQRPDMALARWIAAARAGRPLTVLGSTDRMRDVTDVRQVARALVALAERGTPGPVNVGTGTGHRLGDLVAAVGTAVGREVAVRVRPAAAFEVPATLADPARLHRLVGFTPVTDLAALVARQAAATPVRAAAEEPAQPRAGLLVGTGGAP